jgi:hypothetical protein
MRYCTISSYPFEAARCCDREEQDEADHIVRDSIVKKQKEMRYICSARGNTNQGSPPVVVSVFGVGAGADEGLELVDVAVEGGIVDPQRELRLLFADVERDVRLQLLHPPAVLAVLRQVAQDPPPVHEVDLHDVGEGLLVQAQEAAEIAHAHRVRLRDVAQDGDLAERAARLQQQEGLLLAVFADAGPFLHQHRTGHMYVQISDTQVVKEQDGDHEEPQRYLKVKASSTSTTCR